MRLSTLLAGNDLALNSATKYPSIPTYYELGAKGRPTSQTAVGFDANEMVSVAEKVDGTNSRIIIDRYGDFVLGSREELLFARGDRIKSPTNGIVPTLAPIAERVSERRDLTTRDGLTVIFGEVYGGKINGAREYTSDPSRYGFRVFDIALIPFEAMARALHEIAADRDRGGQRFLVRSHLAGVVSELGLEAVPALGCGKGFPYSVDELGDWLEHIFGQKGGGTLAGLDGTRGKPEGVVIRNDDRTKVAKIRFEDLRRMARSG